MSEQNQRTPIIREELKNILPTSIKTVRVKGIYSNMWGYGENIYLGMAVVGLPTSTPLLYKMDAGGNLETLLTRADVIALTGEPEADIIEIVSVAEAPDGTIFCSTHDHVHILRKRSNAAWEDVYDAWTAIGGTSSYGITIDEIGYVYITVVSSPTVTRSIVRSIDGGTTWTVQWTEAAVTQWIFGMDSYYNRTIAGARNLIIRSVNRMVAQATIVVVGNVRNIHHLGGIKERWIGFLEVSQLFYESIDAGVTWTQPANRLPFSGGAGNPVMSAVSLSGIMVVVDYLGGLTGAISFNGGSTWHPFSLGNYAKIRGVYVTDQHLYLSSIVEAGNPFIDISGGDNGFVLIVPIQSLRFAQDYDPISLWTAQAVPITTGLATGYVLTTGVEKKTFYLKSNQAATVGTAAEGLFIQVWDEINSAYVTVDSISVAANVWTPYMTTHGARRMRLLFIPAIAATVDAFCVLED